MFSINSRVKYFGDELVDPVIGVVIGVARNRKGLYRVAFPSDPCALSSERPFVDFFMEDELREAAH